MKFRIPITICCVAVAIPSRTDLGLVANAVMALFIAALAWVSE